MKDGAKAAAKPSSASLTPARQAGRLDPGSAPRVDAEHGRRRPGCSGCGAGLVGLDVGPASCAQEKARQCRAFAYTVRDNPKDCDRPSRCSWACFRSCSCLRVSAWCRRAASRIASQSEAKSGRSARILRVASSSSWARGAIPSLISRTTSRRVCGNRKRACCCRLVGLPRLRVPGRAKVQLSGWACCKRACCRSIRFSRRSSMCAPPGRTDWT